MVHNQPPYHADHDLPNTNGVASQSPGLIIQSRSKAEARNDLPRDQAPQSTTPTRVVPHSENQRDDVKPLHPPRMEINAHVALMLDAVRWPHRQVPATSGDVAYRAQHGTLLSCLLPLSFPGGDLLFNLPVSAASAMPPYPSWQRAFAAERLRKLPYTAKMSRNDAEAPRKPKGNESALVCPVQKIQFLFLRILASSRLGVITLLLAVFLLRSLGLPSVHKVLLFLCSLGPPPVQFLVFLVCADTGLHLGASLLTLTSNWLS